MKYFSLILLFTYQAAFATCPEVQSFLLKADDLYKQKQYLLSSYHFSSASLLECKETSLKEKAQLGYLYSLYELGEKDEAFHFVTQIDKKISPESQNKLEVFKAVQLGTPTSAAIQKRMVEFEQWKTSLPEPKSAGLAAGLSAVIPGAGQAYAGSYQSAAVAFILNALFLSATLELNRKELPSAALASGLVFSIAYFGNIINAAHTATVYNTNTNKNAIDHQKDISFPELKP